MLLPSIKIEVEFTSYASNGISIKRGIIRILNARLTEDLHLAKGQGAGASLQDYSNIPAQQTTARHGLGGAPYGLLAAAGWIRRHRCIATHMHIERVQPFTAAVDTVVDLDGEDSTGTAQIDPPPRVALFWCVCA